MISKLSAKLTEQLFLKQSISEDERELYTYGYFVLLSHLLYLVLASVFGILLDCFFESIIFYIVFQFIRRSAGGYHASTETSCEIISTLSILASIAFIKCLNICRFQTNLLFLTLVSSLIIFVLSPLDTAEKPLSEKEFRYFQKKSRIILIVVSIIIIISYFTKLKILFVPCCVSLIFESILIISGKIKKIAKKNI